MRVVVVDGANVVGSRPDGWWRDRPAAALRLHTGLVDWLAGFRQTGGPDDEAVLVLEGRARQGVREGTEDGVRTLHARGAGDDAMVEEVTRLAEQGHEVVLVTADRGLRERLDAVGAGWAGPSWLLRQLEGR